MSAAIKWKELEARLKAGNEDEARVKEWKDQFDFAAWWMSGWTDRQKKMLARERAKKFDVEQSALVASESGLK